ncbi:MAG: hypothetical protein F2550_01450 [Actinobacteria bacterium]|uniref:Unannotated protein n=1 Tax=freshwater metagenome TaxID=449393 RepID=A0A6J6D5M4_9ZZZZ|nr:hypothetical protein [Actinomycetota bacterium]
MTLPIAEDLPKAINHLELLVFPSFDEEDAWTLGSALREEAIQIGKGVAIEITRGSEQLFFTLMPGADQVNVDWIRRKRNLVNLTKKSSYETGLQIKFFETPAETVDLNYDDYAWHGGGFPIVLDSGEHVATVVVSGLPQRADHKLVTDVIAKFLSIDLGENGL